MECRTERLIINLGIDDTQRERDNSPLASSGVVVEVKVSADWSGAERRGKRKKEDMG